MSLTIAVCGSRHQDSYLESLRNFFVRMAEAGFDACVNRRFYNYLVDKGMRLPACFLPVDSPISTAVAAISIGGDGTFLRTAQWVGGSSIPILGVNTGHLGFLAHYSPDDADAIAGALKAGEFLVEKRMLLKVESPFIPDHIRPFALNEVAILKEDTSSMITVHTEIGGRFLADYLADGLVISTPTGSTGYNLSVGGPILQPTLDCRVISPIAPHSLTMRPLVVDADTVIKATTTSRAHTYRVSLDGRSFVMGCGTAISISRADFSISVLRLTSDLFADTLREKLHWAVR